MGRQMVLARLPRARPRRHDDGLHAAEEGDVLEGSLGNLLHRRPAARCSRISPATASRFRNTPTWRRKPPSIFRTRTGRCSTSTPMPRGFHTWMPDSEHLDWLSEKYPNTFDKYYRPRWEMWAQAEKEGKRFYNMALPQLCQTCQIPMAYTEPGDPTTICFRETPVQGRDLSFLLGRLQGHLRRRAGEIRAVPGCRCTRSSKAIAAARRCRTCSPGTS